MRTSVAYCVVTRNDASQLSLIRRVLRNSDKRRTNDSLADPILPADKCAARSVAALAHPFEVVDARRRIQPYNSIGRVTALSGPQLSWK